MTYPNDTITTYEYDSLNRLTYLENKGPDGVIASYRYTLGPAGNRLKIEENNGDICDYSYDKLYRLTRENRTGGHDYSISYKYDAFGNREEMNAGGAVTTYDYDDNDRLLEESGPAGAVTYNYDNNGNMTGKATTEETWVYEWNFDNKLISAKLNDNEQPEVSYKYDIDGERVIKTTPEGSTQFLIDINNKIGYSQALRETDASNTELVSYTFGDDLISQDRTVTSYYHYDGLGSTRAITSDDANITDSMKYYAFGSILSKTGSTNVSHLFAGENYDFNLGYYYLRARYYNPEVGLFASMDQFPGLYINPLSLHKYVYSNINPINLTDPSGNFTLMSLMIVVVIIGILSSIATPSYARITCPAKNAELSYDDATERITWYASVSPCGNFCPGSWKARNRVAKDYTKIGNYDGEVIEIYKYTQSHCRKWPKYGMFYIGTDDPKGKDIHGGGSGLKNPCVDYQLWVKTHGCIRMKNKDGIDLYETILSYWNYFGGIGSCTIEFHAR